MRILQYEKWMRLRDGGVVNSVLNLSQALAARGHEVALLTTDDSGVPQDWRLPGGRPGFAAGRGVPACVSLVLRDPLAELRGRRAEQAEGDTVSQVLDRPSMAVVRQHLVKADVVHIHGIWTSSNLQVASAAHHLGIPYVISPHGNLDRQSMTTSPLRKRLHHALLSGRMLRRARAVHCTSEAELAEGSAWFGNPNVRVIPLPFDTSAYQQLPGPNLARSQFPQLVGAPVVLFVGRLHAIKNLERLITASGRWRDAGARCITALAGPPASHDYARSLAALTSRLGLTDRCHLLGMIDGETKLSLYQAADVLVNLSSHENFSLVILEAMCCGTPVITTRRTAIWPELEANGGAIIVDSDDELDRAVQGVIADRERRARLSESARSWSLQYVDTETVMSRYESLYEHAAPPCRPGHLER